MTSNALRLLTLITLLQRRPNQKAAELAGALGVSVRTLHRYMQMLDEMGLPIYTERGPAGGFSLVRGYRMPPLIFTPDEAVVLSLGAGLVEDLLGPLYRTAVRSTLAKLENVMPDEQRSEAAWARRSLVTAGMPHADLDNQAERLERLRDALHCKQRVELVYEGSSGEQTLRAFDPYALAFRQGWWYAIGHCHLREKVRIFRVDRIVELSSSDESYTIPADFEPRSYLREAFQSSSMLRVVMHFAPEFSYLTHQGRSSWETIEEQPDGAVLVSLKAPDAAWGASTALAYGPAVTVLEPPEVIHLLRDWAQSVSARYQGEWKNGNTGSKKTAEAPL